MAPRLRRALLLLQLYDTLGSPSKLCHLWFHTGFVARNYLYFPRPAIDKACGDRRNTTFSPGFGIEIYMTRVSEESPLAPVAPSEDAPFAALPTPHGASGGTPSMSAFGTPRASSFAGSNAASTPRRTSRAHSLVSTLLAGVAVGAAEAGSSSGATTAPSAM